MNIIENRFYGDIKSCRELVSGSLFVPGLLQMNKYQIKIPIANYLLQKRPALKIQMYVHFKYSIHNIEAGMG